MLAVLEQLEAELPALLAESAGWKSLDIAYHPPRVERLYRAWGEYRVNLHRIWPCGEGEALFHPHPWPSAVRLLTGSYRMTVGYGAGVDRPPAAATLVMAPGSRYAMTDPDAWHDVRPLGEPSLSVMITGRPWSRPMPVEPDHPLRPLADADREALLAEFRALYPG